MSDQPLRVHYLLTCRSGEAVEVKAAHLAREQTVEMPEGVAAPAVEARAIGRIERLVPHGAAAARRFAVEIAYPVETVSDFPQLLNLLFGNVSLQRGVHLSAVEWPPAMLERFPGPAFGVDGLRALAGVSERRPLLATALKPLGSTSVELARLAGECARGGIDLIKDDHSLADQPWAPFTERLARCAEAVAAANAAAGTSALYLPNLTGPLDGLGARVAAARAADCRAALVAPLLLGCDAVRALAAEAQLALVGHPALAGALLGRRHGFAPALLFGDLFRLAGCDAVIFPNAAGRFTTTMADCRAVQKRLLAPLGKVPHTFLMLGGGIDAARLAEWIPRYSPDTIYLIGGSLFRHGDLAAAARRLAAVVRGEGGR